MTELPTELLEPLASGEEHRRYVSGARMAEYLVRRRPNSPAKTVDQSAAAGYLVSEGSCAEKHALCGRIGAALMIFGALSCIPYELNARTGPEAAGRGHPTASEGTREIVGRTESQSLGKPDGPLYDTPSPVLGSLLSVSRLKLHAAVYIDGDEWSAQFPCDVLKAPIEQKLETRIKECSAITLKMRHGRTVRNLYDLYVIAEPIPSENWPTTMVDSYDNITIANSPQERVGTVELTRYRFQTRIIDVLRHFLPRRDHND